MKKILLPVLGSALLCFAIQNHVAAKPKGDKNTETTRLLELDKETGNYKYEEVFNYDSTKLTQEAAYKNAKEYIISTLKTADNNIINDDQTFSQLINNGNLLLKPMSGFGWSINTSSVDFKLKLYFKSGRYKLVIDNVIYHAIMMTGNGGQPITQAYSEIKDNKAGNKFKDQIDGELTALVTGLNKAIKNKDAESKSNW